MEPWMLTESEINDIGNTQTTEEDVEILKKQMDAVMADNERKRLRSQSYAEKQAKNPGRFVRLFIVKNKELRKSKMLNNTDKAFILDILPYVNRDSNIITDDRGLPMDAKKICKEFEVSKSVFYTISKKLIECGVISRLEGDGKVYFKLNPEYFEY